MKVVFIELTSIGHYTLVDSLVRIFSVDNKNDIFIFTNLKGKEELNSLLKKFPKVNLTIMEKYQNLHLLLEKCNSLQPDKIYIVTLVNHLSQFYTFNFSIPVTIFIHNIEAWFNNGFRYKINNFRKNVQPTIASLLYNVKTSFFYPYWKGKIRLKQSKTKGKFAVISFNLKHELENYISKDKIEVIPFSVFDESLNNNTEKKSIRISIPGTISATRRDYYSVFNVIEKRLFHLREKFELELLGGIFPNDGGEAIIKEAKRLINKGFKIIFYEKLRVPIYEFDERLALSDIVLGNMIVDQSRFSSYGKTTDSGTVFTMIRAAKPGLIIQSYPVMDEVKSSTLSFKDYDQFGTILIELIMNKNLLSELKEEAVRNSHKFLPDVIYNNLSKSQGFWSQ